MPQDMKRGDNAKSNNFDDESDNNKQRTYSRRVILR
jgi:hypothetical protein